MMSKMMNTQAATLDYAYTHAVAVDPQMSGAAHRRGAQRGGSVRQLGGIGMLQRHAEDFDLTDEQLDQLETMRIEFELEKVDLTAALSKAKIRLRGLMRDESASQKNVYKAINSVSRCEGNLRKMRYRHLHRARSTLSEGQCAKVKAFRCRRESERARQFREQRDPQGSVAERTGRRRGQGKA